MDTYQFLCILLIIAMTNLSCCSAGRILKGSSSSFDEKRRHARNAALYNTWPNGEIPYTISGRMGKKRSRQICKAMIDIELHSCVRFIPLTPQNRTFNFVFISNHMSGCFADIGYRNYRVRSPYRMNVADHCFYKRGVIEHELFHITGLNHEQSRPDRDKYINIYENNIRADMIHNFELQDKKYSTTFGMPYDVNSVMHYSSHAFSVNHLPTMLSKKSPNTILGQREGASRSDFQKVYLLYRCNETGTPTISPFKPNLSDRMRDCLSVKTDPDFDDHMLKLTRTITTTTTNN